MTRKSACAALFIGALIATPVAAAPFDGSEPLICTPVEILACEPGLKCQQETAEIVDLPHFLRISFADKTVVGTRPSGAAVDAKIELVRRSEKKLFLQGIQKNFAWAMGIDETNGRMTLTISDDRSGYVIFGACTPR